MHVSCCLCIDGFVSLIDCSEGRNAYGLLMEKIEGKKPHGRSRQRWEDKIRIDLQEVGWGHGLDWSGSGQGQVAGTCKRGNEPSGSIKRRLFPDWLRTD